MPAHSRSRTNVAPPSRRLSRGRFALPGQGPALHLAGYVFTTLALLFFAGCKKKTPPPQARAKGAIIATQPAPGSAFVMSLAMDPAQPKFARKTTFRVTVKQTAGTPVDDGQVEVSLVMPLMDIGKNQFTIKPAGSGQYEGAGEFSMAGEWEVVVSATAQGKTGKTTFNVNVEE